MWWVEAIGYAGTGLTVTAWAMKTSIQLRVAGILSSVAFLIYGYLTQSFPVMVMELILMPLNVLRLIEMMRLVASVPAVVEAQPSRDLTWLLPHMRRVRLGPSETLFRRGETADRLFVVLSGEVALLECGSILSAGEIIGEAGLFEPGQLQAVTCRSLGPVEIGEIKQSLLSELFFQNPAFGYRLTQFALARLRMQVATQLT